MASASITITDDPNGKVEVSADFGLEIDQQSHAHGLVYALLQSVLSSSKNVTEVEDTAGDMNGESALPNKIIVPTT
jgi:hypothetical protein